MFFIYSKTLEYRTKLTSESSKCYIKVTQLKKKMLIKCIRNVNVDELLQSLFNPLIQLNSNKIKIVTSNDSSFTLAITVKKEPIKVFVDQLEWLVLPYKDVDHKYEIRVCRAHFQRVVAVAPIYLQWLPRSFYLQRGQNRLEKNNCFCEWSR